VQSDGTYHAAFKPNDPMNVKPRPFAKSFLVNFAHGSIFFFSLIAICKHESPQHMLRVETSWPELVQVARSSNEGPSDGDVVWFSSKMCLEAAHPNPVAVRVFEAYQFSAHVIKLILAMHTLWAG